MPEIKNHFTGGKMNKDVDERLIPKGQYRDAMNIQVSTSEESDVGSVQNLLGNSHGCSNYTSIGQGFTVGSISDEKNDSFYWFVSGQSFSPNEAINNITNEYPLTMHDSIWKHDSSGCTPVFIDKFGISQTTNLTTNSDVLTSINVDVYNNLEEGWKVFGYNITDGSSSNTAVISSTLPAAPVWANFDSVYNYTPSTTVSYYEVLIPMINTASSGSPANFVQSTGNVVYLRNFSGSVNGLPGNTIEILPYDTSNAQTYTIDTATNFGITINTSVIGGSGSTAVTTPVIKLELTTNLSLISPALSLSQASGVAGSNAPYADVTSSGGTIDCLISFPTNTPVATATGTVYLPSSFNFNSISVGEEVYPQWLNSINTVVDASASICIGAIDAATNSIDLEYCNTGIAFDGWQVGGFVYGVPQLTGGAIQFSSNISVQLYGNLDLSSGYSHLFFYGPRTLNFNHNQYITAVNIVDDMLFWTDGKTEPKKINIPLSIQGTTNSGADLTASKHTRLINPDQNIFYNNNKLARERHLTVIRKAPKNKLTMELYSGRKPELNYSGVLQISAETNQYESSLWAQRSTVSGAAINPYEYDFSSFTTEEGSNLLKIQVDTDLNGNSQFDVDTWEIGSTVVLKAYQNGVQPVTPITDYDIKGTIVEWPWTNSSGTTEDVNSFTSNSTWGVKVAIKIDSMPGVTPTATSGGVLKYVIDLWEESEKLFEFKFPRFSYRYKYIDGEYSTFAPFTDVAFSPGSFDYHPRKGYNLGMSNNLESLTLRNFINEDMPSDVVEIDILYKEDKTPDVFVVETFNRNQEKSNTGSFVNMNNWMANEFTIEKENIKSILPPNQLLRPWDNVPRTALAQEITGNRIVYGNYTQNYNLKNPYVSPNFSHFLTDDINTSKSIKSLREYQLGVIFIDQYGRETPVLTHNSGLFKVGKEKSISSNKLYASVKSSSIPQEMKYLRFYIKETSGEYYNLAMDRWYDAEDDNIWLAFPSSDRDKVDIDTFLILKKGVATSEGVEESARYKILAIENEAPDFIKTEEFKIAELIHDISSSPASGGDMYDHSITECPVIGQNSFRAKYGQFDGSTAQDLDQVQGELYVDFTLENSSRSSKKYRITEVVKDVNPPLTGELVESPVAFVFKIEGRFEEDVNFITDDAQGGTNATRILNRTITRFYKRVVENSPKFDGRFFVKIYFDDIIQKYIKAASETGDTSSYYTVASKKIYSLSQDIQDRHDGTAFSGTYNKVWKGLYSTTTPNADWYFPYNMYSVGAPFSNVLQNQAYFQSHNETAFFNAYFGGGLTPTALSGHWSRTNLYPVVSWHAPHGTTDFFDTLDTFQVRTEDIWCIDFGIYRGYYESDMIKPGEGDISAFHQDIQETDSSKKGIEHGSSESTMSLSFGGLRPSYEESSNSTGFFGPFYDISDQAREWKQELQDNTNPSSPQTYTEYGDYSDDAPIASRLFSGYKFRWKEDPSQTVYTITGQTINGQLVNYQPIINLIISTSAFNSPANYRKNWTFNVTPKMQWDPVQGDSLGVITEGLDIRSHQPSTGTFNDIEVSSNFTTNNNSILHIDNTVFTKTWDTKTNSFATITPGLILTEINGSTTFNHDNNPVLLYSIEDVSGGKKQLNFIGYQGTEVSFDVTGGDTLVFRQPTMNGLSINSARNINTLNTQITGPGTTPQTGIGAVGYTIEFIEPVVTESLLPDDPAVWETEPKNTTDLDLYYEAGDTIPLELNNSTNNIFAPIGTVVSVEIDPASTTPMIPEETVVLSWNDNIVEINNLADDTDFVTGDVATFLRPDGSSLVANVIGLAEPKASSNTSYYLEIDRDIRSSQRYGFTWNNCYSFGNGVESNRIRDNFNQPFISNGVKVSSTLSEALEEEHRKHGLIYSGIYNSTSGINNLNQFIQAEKITKDINPTYGSIQKLYAGWGQQGNLIALCEDRILKILANKDALFNADGDSNVTATNRVLGTATPYSGEYGISKNPESFAAESYRAYFSDKVRGTIMRLSLDGLTPISSFGMKDWFKDNLRLSNKIIGSYDDQKEEYNITLHGDTIDKTVTFREDVKGWVSFKSFTPENAISCANRYYTFLQGKPWKHHDESVDRNTFYGVHNTNTHSTLTVVLNEMPGVVKSFNTINYEGSQSAVRLNTLDNQYYNLQGKPGWVAADIHTDLEKGGIEEFIEKEGKWFNYIRGRVIQHDLSSNIKIESDGGSLFDQSSFAIQGLGILDSIPTPTPVNGCTNPVATNYDPLATVDDGSCILLPVNGCTISSASNFNSSANTDDGSCIWYGCIDPAATNTTTFTSDAINYSGVGITDDGSCTYCIDGCTDPTAFNYNASATCDDGSCIPFVYGCAQPTASNYDSTVNSDDGSCIWSFCPEEQDNSYGTVNGVVLYSGSSASIQTGMNTLIATVTTYYNIPSFPPAWWDSSPCTSGGCMNQNSSNYSSAATWDDGTCGGCTDPLSYNYVPNINIDDGSCATACDFGCGVTGNTTVGATSFFVSSFTHVTNSGSSSTSDLGSITIEQGQLACFINTSDSINPYPYSYSLSPSQVGNALFSSSTSVGPNNQVTYSGLDAGTYTITATSTLPHQNQPGITPCSISITHTVLDQTPVYGCTDSAANNYNSSAGVDDGSCTYTVTCYACTSPLSSAVVNNGITSLIQTVAGSCTNPPAFPTGVSPSNFTLAHAIATYGDSGTSSSPNPAGQGCNLGCMDNTAINYNPNYNNDHNQTCEYCDMGTDTNGNALGSPIQINITDSTSMAGNGIIQVLLDNNAPYVSTGAGYDIKLYQVAGPSSPNTGGTFVQQDLNSQGVSMINIAAGYYYVTVTTQTIGASGNTCSYTSSVKLVDQFITGCMSIHATNYNSSADIGMYNPNPGGNSGNWLNSNNDCNNGNPAPGHCCFTTVVKRCGANGLVESSGSTYNNQSNRAMPAGAAALGWKTYAQQGQLVASNVWKSRSAGQPCLPGCTNALYCEYDNLATWRPYPPSNNNASAVDPCQTYSGGVIPKYNCNHQFQCQSVSVCDPGYATATYNTLQSCNNACIAPLNNSNTQTTI